MAQSTKHTGSTTPDWQHVSEIDERAERTSRRCWKRENKLIPSVLSEREREVGFRMDVIKEKVIAVTKKWETIKMKKLTAPSTASYVYLRLCGRVCLSVPVYVYVSVLVYLPSAK